MKVSAITFPRASARLVRTPSWLRNEKSNAGSRGGTNRAAAGSVRVAVAANTPPSPAEDEAHERDQHQPPPRFRRSRHRGFGSSDERHEWATLYRPRACEPAFEVRTRTAHHVPFKRMPIPAYT